MVLEDFLRWDFPWFVNRHLFVHSLFRHVNTRDLGGPRVCPSNLRPRIPVVCESKDTLDLTALPKALTPAETWTFGPCVMCGGASIPDPYPSEWSSFHRRTREEDHWNILCVFPASEDEIRAAVKSEDLDKEAIGIPYAHIQWQPTLELADDIEVIGAGIDDVESTNPEVSETLFKELYLSSIRLFHNLNHSTPEAAVNSTKEEALLHLEFP